MIDTYSVPLTTIVKDFNMQVEFAATVCGVSKAENRITGVYWAQNGLLHYSAAGMVLDIVQVGAGRAALDIEPRAVFSSWETVSWSFSSTSLSEAAAASWNTVSLWIMSSVSSSFSPFLQKP